MSILFGHSKYNLASTRARNHPQAVVLQKLTGQHGSYLSTQLGHRSFFPVPP